MSVSILLITLLSLPLTGALINGLFGKQFPKVVSGSIGTIAVGIAFAVVLGLFGQIHEPVKVNLFQLIHFDGFNINASFLIDQLSIWMALIITGIGTLIHLFSMGYMSHDEGYYKFFTYLNLFIFAMLLLVLGSNYFILFFGWEGLEFAHSCSLDSITVTLSKEYRTA